MPSLPLRIAVLECDTPMAAVQAQYGGYGNIFTNLLHAATPLTTPPLTPADIKITAYDVVTAQVYPELEDIDAVLMSGSKHNSFDNDPWILKLVDFCKVLLAQRRVRIIGVCFGHQILGRAMGSEVGRSDKGWEISVLPMELTEKGKEIFGTPTLSLHQMHRDIVFSYPPDVESLAYTSKCAVQAMYVPKRLITVQGHPEFSEPIMAEILKRRHEKGLFDAAMFEDAMGRAGAAHQGVVAAKAFLNFAMEE